MKRDCVLQILSTKSTILPRVQEPSLLVAELTDRGQVEILKKHVLLDDFAEPRIVDFDI